MDGNGSRKLGRRALLAAGAAGVAAAAVQAVASPAATVAADHDPLRIGETNTGSTETILNAPGSHGLSASSGGGDGFRGGSSAGGRSGVYGYSTNADGFGVFGRNTVGDTSGSLGGKDQGVRGSAHAAEGVHGESGTNCGVVGLTQGANQAGVYGYNTSADGSGVVGQNTATGANGRLGSGYMGVEAYATVDVIHLALAVKGRAAFSRSGTLTIAKNKSSVGVAATALSSSSMVLATLQTNRAGVYIQAAMAYPAADKITIYLNKKVTAATKVAYFILD